MLRNIARKEKCKRSLRFNVLVWGVVVKDIRIDNTARVLAGLTKLYQAERSDV
jgi:hypothetical protein